MHYTHPRGKYTIAGEVLQAICLVTMSIGRRATYVDDPHVAPQRSPDDIAALPISTQAKTRIYRMDSLDCNCVVGDPVTHSSVVFDIAEDLVRVRVRIEGRLPPMLDQLKPVWLPGCRSAAT